MQEILHDRAALYVAGAMLSPARTEFERLLEFHEELQVHVAKLQEAAVAVLLGGMPQHVPPVALKARILAAAAMPAPVSEQGVAKVRTDAAGLIEWVNPAFTVMCGYTLDELRGKKPGTLLQGKLTDPVAVTRLRTAISECRPVESELINYHKDGSPYRVLVAITPILDDERRPLFYVAEEQKLALAG